MAASETHQDMAIASSPRAHVPAVWLEERVFDFNSKGWQVADGQFSVMLFHTQANKFFTQFLLATVCINKSITGSLEGMFLHPSPKWVLITAQ